MRSPWHILILFPVFALTACNHNAVDPAPRVPSDFHVYRFERNGQNTVVNTGQIVRGALIEELRIYIENLASPGAQPVTFEDLYRYFDNSGMTISGEPLLPVDLPLNPPTLAEISGNRDLETRVGAYRDEIVSSIQQWCTILSENSQDPLKLGSPLVYVDAETGHDLAIMYQLTGLGGANLSHGMHGYFRFVDKKENDKLVSYGTDTLIFTEMEHHWDESYGYFGAAHNQHDFAVEEVANYEEGLHYKDNYMVDGSIDLRNEYNFSFAVEAAKRDVSSATGIEFLRTIYEAFYAGRRAIVNKQYDSLLIHKAIILDLWEQSIAATAVHHLNKTYSLLDAIKNGSSTSPLLFYRHWSAMYKYVEMLRYNYANRFLEWQSILKEKLTNSDVPFPKSLIDDPARVTDYQSELLTIRGMLQSVYGFTDDDTEGW